MRKFYLERDDSFGNSLPTLAKLINSNNATGFLKSLAKPDFAHLRSEITTGRAQVCLLSPICQPKTILQLIREILSALYLSAALYSFASFEQASEGGN